MALQRIWAIQGHAGPWSKLARQQLKFTAAWIRIHCRQMGQGAAAAWGALVLGDGIIRKTASRQTGINYTEKLYLPMELRGLSTSRKQTCRQVQAARLKQAPSDVQPASGLLKGYAKLLMPHSLSALCKRLFVTHGTHPGVQHRD